MWPGSQEQKWGCEDGGHHTSYPSWQERSLQLVLVKLPVITSGPGSTDPGYNGCWEPVSPV